MEKNNNWFSTFRTSANFEYLKKHPVAYFCAEYALTSDIETYAGGLGILAGDMVREAAAQHIPLVAVGLYYHDGYETLHPVDERGYIDEPHVHPLPEHLGLTPVLDGEGGRLIISVPIQERSVKAQVWSWQVGNVTVYLLDTNVNENEVLDRKITDHLYVADKETRLKQEIVLGIGGYRLLQVLDIHPSVYHLNEGHSAMLSLEILHEQMKKHTVSFQEAKPYARERIVFTNHTLVISGNDVFNSDLVSLLLSGYVREAGIPMNEILDLGIVRGSSEFSMTMMSLRMAGKMNAVSKLHAKKAKELWPDYQMVPITNGIHLPTWNAISDEEHIWQSHQANKRELLQKIQLYSGKTWHEDDLLIGWARRLVSYKRPMALFDDIEKLVEIATNKKRPVRIIIAERLHPSDHEGAKMLEQIRGIIEKHLKDTAVYLPDYDMKLAQMLVAGCDIWLNTPIVGFEACGTSGMKAALNGALPCSTKDGWVHEIDLYKVGWPLDNDAITASIMGILEHDIVPLYYDRDNSNIPQNWVENMSNARKLIQDQFSASRMLQEYIEQLYQPLLFVEENRS